MKIVKFNYNGNHVAFKKTADISKSQQYKLAGNSIVVDVLEAIFDKMFIDTENNRGQLTLF